MRVLTLLSQKGGTGKTTIALHLAVAAERDGKPLAVIDLDPQQSAALWGDTRASETPVVVSAQAARLPQVLDTARAADFCLIPCRAAILDLKAIGTSIDVARLAKTPFAVLLNAVPPRGTLSTEAADVVRGYGVELVPVCLVHRAAYVHALTSGQTAQEYEPKGKAAEEITQLYTWLCKYVYT
jgi:chromosome partitioning protein